MPSGLTAQPKSSAAATTRFERVVAIANKPFQRQPAPLSLSVFLLLSLNWQSTDCMYIPIIVKSVCVNLYVHVT